MSQYVVMLRDGRYWGPVDPTADIDAALHYPSRWLALAAISGAGAGVMHMASIVEHGEREEPPERGP